MPFYLDGVGVEAELLAGMPLYRGHEVADQPYHTLLPLVGVVTCVLGNSWRDARVYIPRPRGLQSICQLAGLDQLKLLLLFLQAICRGHKPALEALLFDGILWYGEFIVAEACLIFGGGHVIVILLLSVYRSLRRDGSSILLL